MTEENGSKNFFKEAFDYLGRAKGKIPQQNKILSIPIRHVHPKDDIRFDLSQASDAAKDVMVEFNMDKPPEDLRVIKEGHRSFRSELRKAKDELQRRPDLPADIAEDFVRSRILKGSKRLLSGDVGHHSDHSDGDQ